MTLGVRVYPEAADELDAAIEWYEQGGVGRGEKFEAVYEDVIDRCVMWPESGAGYPLDDSDVVVRTAKVSRSPYRVVYLIEDETLWVVALAHGRRRPGYWKDRVE